MDASKGYRRAKHDLSNRLQLLSVYMDLKKYDAAELLVKEWSESLRAEQAFLQLDWPLFVEEVLNEKINHTNFKWVFLVEAKDVPPQDEKVFHSFSKWLRWLKVQKEEQREIIIAVKENEASCIVEFIVSGETALPSEQLNMQWFEKNNGRGARIVLEK